MRQVRVMGKEREEIETPSEDHRAKSYKASPPAPSLFTAWTTNAPGEHARVSSVLSVQSKLKHKSLLCHLYECTQILSSFPQHR